MRNRAAARHHKTSPRWAEMAVYPIRARSVNRAQALSWPRPPSLPFAAKPANCPESGAAPGRCRSKVPSSHDRRAGFAAAPRTSILGSPSCPPAFPDRGTRSAGTPCSRSSGAAGWAWSCVPARTTSVARWHSRCSPPSSPTRRSSPPGSGARRACSPPSTAPTSSPSTTTASTTAVSSSRRSSCAEAIWPTGCGSTGHSPSTRVSTSSHSSPPPWTTPTAPASCTATSSPATCSCAKDRTGCAPISATSGSPRATPPT